MPPSCEQFLRLQDCVHAASCASYARSPPWSFDQISAYNNWSFDQMSSHCGREAGAVFSHWPRGIARGALSQLNISESSEVGAIRRRIPEAGCQALVRVTSLPDEY